MGNKSGAARVQEQEREQGRRLCGMKEIANYARRSESTILAWVRDMDFPAKKVGGIWESNSAAVDRWFLDRIGVA